MPTEKSSTVALLKRIEARIADPTRWCQGSAAVTKAGQPINSRSRRAVRWCVYGAFSKEVGEAPQWHVLDNLSDAARAVHPGVSGVVAVNEDLGHDAVMAVIRRAIETAEGEATP